MRILPFFAVAFALLGSLIAGCLVTANTAMAQNAPNINVTIQNSAGLSIAADTINCLSVTLPCVQSNGMLVPANSSRSYTVTPNNTRPMYNVTYGTYFNGVLENCMFQATNYPINSNGTCNNTFWAPSASKTNGTGTEPKCPTPTWSLPQAPSCVLNVTFTFGQ